MSQNHLKLVGGIAQDPRKRTRDQARLVFTLWIEVSDDERRNLGCADAVDYLRKVIAELDTDEIKRGINVFEGIEVVEVDTAIGK